MAGEPAVNPGRSVNVFFFWIGPLLLSLQQVYVVLFPTASSLVICLVNSVINHLLTVIELLLIAILHPPRCWILDLADGDSLSATLSKGFGKKCTFKGQLIGQSSSHKYQLLFYNNNLPKGVQDDVKVLWGVAVSRFITNLTGATSGRAGIVSSGRSAGRDSADEGSRTEF